MYSIETTKDGEFLVSKSDDGKKEFWREETMRPSDPDIAYALYTPEEGPGPALAVCPLKHWEATNDVPEVMDEVLEGLQGRVEMTLAKIGFDSPCENCYEADAEPDLADCVPFVDDFEEARNRLEAAGFVAHPEFQAAIMKDPYIVTMG